LLQSETKQKTFILFRLEAKRKIRSEMKRKEKFLEAKQSEKTLFRFA
jgi:hypothetical protein